MFLERISSVLSYCARVDIVIKISNSVFLLGTCITQTIAQLKKQGIVIAINHGYPGIKKTNKKMLCGLYQRVD